MGEPPKIDRLFDSIDDGLMSLLGRIARRSSPFSLTGRLIRLPLRLVPRSAVVPVLSGINRGMRWVAGSASTNGSWIGTYEVDHIAALAQFVRPGAVVYDVGANVGYYTLALSTLVGDSGHVYCFEPDARNAFMLRRHIQMNNLRNVTFVQAAVSRSSGLVGFGGRGEGAKISSESSYLLPSISLDSFLAVGNPSPSFIKIDIEGGECDALAGAVSILSKGKAVWMLATHGPSLRLRCCEFMANFGYRYVGFDGISDPGEAADFIAIPASFDRSKPNQA